MTHEDQARGNRRILAANASQSFDIRSFAGFANFSLDFFEIFFSPER
jgi:hypothetical protein